MYLEPHYISPCHAGSLFGVITASGLIYPCEILDDKLLGDLRKNDMDFKKYGRVKIQLKQRNLLKKPNVIVLMNVH